MTAEAFSITVAQALTSMFNTFSKLVLGIAMTVLPFSSVAGAPMPEEQAPLQTQKLTKEFIRILKNVKVGGKIAGIESIKGVKKDSLGGKPFYVIDSEGVRGFIAYSDKKISNVLIIVDGKELVDVGDILKAVSKHYKCKPTKKSKRYLYEYSDENLSIDFYASKSGFGVEIQASK